MLTSSSTLWLSSLSCCLPSTICSSSASCSPAEREGERGGREREGDRQSDTERESEKVSASVDGRKHTETRQGDSGCVRPGRCLRVCVYRPND
eukprot:3717817-Rhodomonas_salina.2